MPDPVDDSLTAATAMVADIPFFSEDVAAAQTGLSVLCSSFAVMDRAFVDRFSNVAERGGREEEKRIYVGEEHRRSM
jgi:hypothetical protein